MENVMFECPDKRKQDTSKELKTRHKKELGKLCHERKYLSDSEFSPEDNGKPQKALSRKCPESIDTLNGYSDSYVENSLEEPKTDAGT